MEFVAFFCIMYFLFGTLDALPGALLWCGGICAVALILVLNGVTIDKK